MLNAFRKLHEELEVQNPVSNSSARKNFVETWSTFAIDGELVWCHTKKFVSKWCLDHSQNGIPCGFDSISKITTGKFS
ncbi:hypothetical protein B9P99_00380 [Candidatus Marsarchaeota G1 archaeon OSP_B]|uniref:Uncharacterized protein n=4 Tax=Candidatus Marsarchaeota group 1 TaxID=2203770 RepID=A0A2R6AIP9_9ARCH|nr:MAG: hypothetical protein B9Q01_05130 [Candidatus Marsarchaeota G1 archaeon OSP_D]PSN86218.1 MAG: hypothetical protein B9Q02_03200 [Candidatus Marsarchaeota G1 archaeon BE_D]PSN88775.1 MAG: hypothetical protein B9Q00_04155 [Candidatus Marsarchaeota G1 archaeon OSP_C]PSN96386.1 MAG: hypothetical protein B9P99_00380 [Candidatus Marsarchaeota G1 archaeon OSP_B]